jgi:hypothetical protein
MAEFPTRLTDAEQTPIRFDPFSGYFAGRQNGDRVESGAFPQAKSGLPLMILILLTWHLWFA